MKAFVRSAMRFAPYALILAGVLGMFFVPVPLITHCFCGLGCFDYSVRVYVWSNPCLTGSFPVHISASQSLLLIGLGIVWLAFRKWDDYVSGTRTGSGRGGS